MKNVVGKLKVYVNSNFHFYLPSKFLRFPQKDFYPSAIKETKADELFVSLHCPAIGLFVWLSDSTYFM